MLYVENSPELMAYFTPENLEDTKEIVSESGAYRLKIETYSTYQGAWNITKGLVYRVSDDSLIAEIPRNYHDFWAAFVEGHANGHDYMITSSDYQGYVIVDLTTSGIHEHMNEGHDIGAGFCWVNVEAIENKTKLHVNGCHWGAPYEDHIYDFSNPVSLPLTLLQRKDEWEDEYETIAAVDSNDNIHIMTDEGENPNAD